MDFKSHKQVIDLGEKSIDLFKLQMNKTEKALAQLIDKIPDEKKQDVTLLKANFSKILSLSKKGDLNKIQEIVDNLKKQHGR